MFKSRTLAARACSGGKVHVNSHGVKPHHLLRVGDEVRVTREERIHILGVVALADKRLSAPLAQELYEDRSPASPSREERGGLRDRGLGRPTKRDRRLLRRLRGRD
jgi:ribosome-associated heat shock protein Hsp15